MRILTLIGLGLASILTSIGCVDRGPVTVLFTSDVKGRLRPAG